MRDRWKDDPAVGPAAQGRAGIAEERCGEVRRRLATAVVRLCPTWLAAQADDIVQAATLKILPMLSRGEGDRALNSSYLWRVAYSATIDEIRRVRRRAETSLDEDTMPEPVEPGPAKDPERLHVADEIADGIGECLRGLVRPRRLAVTLHLQGHTVSETARLLGWATKRADNLVYRGMSDLRRCLRAKGLEP